MATQRAVLRPGALLRSVRPNGQVLNRIQPGDGAIHEWYRFVLAFPPHLVQGYLQRFDCDHNSLVLDPFCGTGTTLVECKRDGIPSVGIEAHPLTAFVASVKVDWSPDPQGLTLHARSVAEVASRRLLRQGLPDDPIARKSGRASKLLHLPPEAHDLLLEGSISPRPLHKVLVLLDVLKDQRSAEFTDIERLALADVLVSSAGNITFGPEVGVTPPKLDAPVVSTWLGRVERIAADLVEVKGASSTAPARVIHGDARTPSAYLEPASVSTVITSPPYPNEKDYTRTSRLESVILGFIRSRDDLRAVKQLLVRSNTRGVFKADSDDQWVSGVGEIGKIAESIEARRVELGKTSGFERLYPRVAKLYFGGMHRHLADLRSSLRPGAELAYVVGDQASYLRVMIRTGKILGELATSLGYELQSIDLFRTRLATATREQLREEVVVLRWPG